MCVTLILTPGKKICMSHTKLLFYHSKAFKRNLRVANKFSREDSGLNVCTSGGMPKITIGITGLHEILGQDYKIEEPYWGSSHFFATLTCKACHRQNYRKWPKLPRLGP